MIYKLNRSSDEKNPKGTATEKQIEFLKELGVQIPDGLSKSDASELISEGIKLRDFGYKKEARAELLVEAIRDANQMFPGAYEARTPSLSQVRDALTFLDSNSPRWDKYLQDSVGINLDIMWEIFVPALLRCHPTLKRKTKREANAPQKPKSGCIGKTFGILFVCFCVLKLIDAQKSQEPPAPRRVVPAQDRHNATASEPTTTEAANPATAPSPNPAKESMAEAIRLYPAIALKDSPLNKEFVRLHNEAKHTDPEFLVQSDWPMTLAKRAFESLIGKK